MKIAEAIKLLNDLGGPDDEVYFFHFSKDEANELLDQDMENPEAEEVELTNAEWSEIVKLLVSDDAIYETTDESFRQFIDQVFSRREKVSAGGN